MPIPSEPEGFPYHQWYRLARRRLPLAAEISASSPDRRAWLHVTPKRSDEGYIVTYYEVERDRYAEACDTWDWDLPGLELNKQHVTVRDDEELLRVLRQWLADLTILKDPYFSGAPW